MSAQNHKTSTRSNVPLTTNLFPATFTYSPPSHYQKITTLDTHTGGEPLRIIISGLPPIHGTTVLQKRRYFMEHYDHLRTGLLLEPRGHADMYGAILTVPSKPEEADLDVFFINTYGYSPMCGHAILAIAKVVLETGIVNKSDQENPEVRISTPAGMVYACTNTHSLTGEVTRTCFKNVPSFVYALDQTVSVPGLGEVKFDIAFGGGFYAILPISSLPLAQEPQILEITPENYSTFISLGRKIRKAILSDPKIAITHPTEPDLSDLYGVIFTSPPHDSKNFSRNVNIFEDGEVDRSPTGTGVSARAALCLERGEVKVGEEWTIESIVGSEMTGKVLEEVMWEGFKSVVPEVGGEAFVMGKNEFYFDPRDGFKEGFMLR